MWGGNGHRPLLLTTTDAARCATFSPGLNHSVATGSPYDFDYSCAFNRAISAVAYITIDFPTLCTDSEIMFDRRYTVAEAFLERWP